MSKKDVYNNKEKCKRWRENLREDQMKLQNHKFKNKERMRNARQKWKDEGSDELIEERRRYERIRKRQSREKLKEMRHAQQNLSEPYKCKQTLAKAAKKVEDALPKDLQKKIKVLEVLNRKYKLPLPTERNKKNSSNTLPENVVTAIKEFYMTDNVSVQAAGKKDTVLFEGELIAKRFMIMTVGEAYELYKEDYPNEPVGKSVFFSMRPRHVKLVTKMPHNMCVCMYHANFGYFLESCAKIIPSFPKNCESFLKSVCCNIHNENCMTSNCKKCLTDLKYQFIPLAYFANMDDEVNWKQWRKIDNRIALTNTVATFSELVLDVERKLPLFKTHFFVKRAQQQYFEETKNNLQPTELAIQIDFAENYRLTNQNEVQSAHFSYSQVSIFTCVAWLAGATKSFALISDKLTHNKHDVFIFLLNLLREMNKSNGCFSKIFIFSDGSSAQFKNKFILRSLVDFRKQLGCTSVEWNFFASSHGKGPVDGVGAVLKRKVWQLTKSKNLLIPDALSFYNCAQNNVNAVKIYFMSSDEVNKHSVLYNLDEKWKDVESIPGISKLHYFCCNDQEVTAARTAYSEKETV